MMNNRSKLGRLALAGATALALLLAACGAGLAAVTALYGGLGAIP